MTRRLQDTGQQLMPVKKDHNCCPKCKKSEFNKLDYHQSAAYLEKLNDLVGASVFRKLEQEAADKAADKQRKHMEDDRHMRRFISSMHNLFVHVDQVEDFEKGRHLVLSLSTFCLK
jgi:hypothetical protein